MASNAREWWKSRRECMQAQEGARLRIHSPSEPPADKAAIDAILEQRVAMARNCADEGAREGAKAALKAFAITAIPTLVAARTLPWAKAHLNYTGQALIICGATIATYFIVSDRTILECARMTSYERIKAERAAAGNRDA